MASNEIICDDNKTFLDMTILFLFVLRVHRSVSCLCLYIQNFVKRPKDTKTHKQIPPRKTKNQNEKVNTEWHNQRKLWWNHSINVCILFLISDSVFNSEWKQYSLIDGIHLLRLIEIFLISGVANVIHRGQNCRLFQKPI